VRRDLFDDRSYQLPSAAIDPVIRPVRAAPQMAYS
jgi:hypothetical protein